MVNNFCSCHIYYVNCKKMMMMVMNVVQRFLSTASSTVMSSRILYPIKSQLENTDPTIIIILYTDMFIRMLTPDRVTVRMISIPPPPIVDRSLRSYLSALPALP